MLDTVYGFVFKAVHFLHSQIKCTIIENPAAILPETKEKGTYDIGKHQKEDLGQAFFRLDQGRLQADLKETAGKIDQ